MHKIILIVQSLLLINFLSWKYTLTCIYSTEKNAYVCGNGRKNTPRIMHEGEMRPPLRRPIYTSLFHFYPDDFTPHRGIDMIGTLEILPAMHGKVIALCRWNCFGDFGKFVIIEHTPNLYTMYAHLSTVYVKEGENVERQSHDDGTLLGIMGNTGKSFGMHLHFEVRSNSSNDFSFRLDPVRFLPIYEEQCSNMFGIRDALRAGGSYRTKYQVGAEGLLVAI